MRRLILIGILLALCSILGAQPYVIDQFDVKLTLSKGAALMVEERIDVTFNESRRGIFRVIPVDYENGKGINRRMLLDQIEVTDGRVPLTRKVSFEGGNVRIRIGDEKIFLPPGTRKTYVIRYRCRGMMNWFEKNEGWGASAQLYWNVTGDQWDTSIGRASARLEFPTAAGDEELRAKIFVGPYGSTINQIIEKVGPAAWSDRTQTRTTLRSGGLEILREAPLEAYNGLTLVLDLPYNAVAKPGPLEAAWTFISANLGFGLPLIAIPLIIFFWFRHGRDPAAGPLTVQFDPPEGLTGSAAGTLIDEKVDTRDVSAGIFSLAVKGYVAIEPDEEGFIFKRRTAKLHMLKEVAGPELSMFEAKLFGRLRACGSTIDDSDLRTNVAPYIGELKTALYEELVDRGYYLVDPNSARVRWFAGGLVCLVIAGFLCTALTPYNNPLPAIVGGVLSLIAIGIGSQAMPRRTKMGSIARRQVEGFAEFIKRARADEFDWMAKKHPNAALFEAYLPHAIAFGLAAEWGKRFEGIVMEPPSWYYVGHGRPFYVGDFSRDVNTISDTVGSAASTPPRSSGGSGGSSGFGGGGFSGGGFGGGGGGSW